MSTSLRIDTLGSGPELVFLHGWGLHGGLWQPVVPPLAANFCLHRVDLPGHGASAYDGTLTLTSVVERLHRAFPRPVTVIGWSLGGLFALEWARTHPSTVEKLVLIGSSPCFRQRSDWPCAMHSDTLEAFAADLADDYHATLRRFLNLQLMGDDSARALARDMLPRLFAHGEPHPAALRDGLDILRDVDWRPWVAEVRQPTLLLYGARDRLVPAAAARWLHGELRNARLELFEDSAHAPHWSHPVAFAEAVKSFIYD